MDLQLKNKVAFVAGSSRGIGRSIAETFLAEGAKVVLTGRQPGPLNSAATELQKKYGADQVLAVTGDFSQPKAIEAAVRATRERWGVVDCLVANIGTGIARGGWQLNDDDWQNAFDVNLLASVRVAQAVLPGMLEARRGSIVFIASIVGVESTPAPLTYSAAKAALINYSKNLARQVGAGGVRVNCVAPGNVLFPGGSWEKKLELDREKFTSYIESEVALRRFATPDEIANVAIFVSSDRASFCTGECIIVDGGQTRSM